ncbi:MAG: ABC transporter substrate-binding protein [Sphingomonadaceae bacterium]|uniref:heme/hemin ABC transporter substrate-binding protein n=1 Tax=Thermaurantiacus sp. TaxID=2820283 RepID=UPI00298ED7A4|nr:ABC transporter substrate-binding protein [Thermaurantiacus sp.]MCS6986287.1 ABC transporter substrate-binding protein [Sphingomonadaceae bacterium]MDW8415736.1 ABC transporter substrate-binding protein [Thermaurantiacus sp.]
MGWWRVLLALGLLVATPAAAQRIVTLGSEVTEIVFALGRGAQVVAVDDTSTHPPDARALPRIGYFRALAPEPVLAQRPTLVLAAAGAGPEAVLRQVERAGVRVVRLPEAWTADGVEAKIRAIGRALDAEAAAERLAAQTRAALAALAPPPDAPRPRMMLVLATAPGRVLAAGQDTAGDGFIRLAGGENVFRAQGYRPLSAEAALAAAPEVILVPSHVARMVGGLEAIAREPVLARTPAVRQGRLILIDSQAALGFGPRLPEALAALRRRLAG